LRRDGKRLFLNKSVSSLFPIIFLEKEGEKVIVQESDFAEVFMSERLCILAGMGQKEQLGEVRIGNQISNGSSRFLKGDRR
jgi:hypothetical protein